MKSRIIKLSCRIACCGLFWALASTATAQTIQLIGSINNSFSPNFTVGESVDVSITLSTPLVNTSGTSGTFSYVANVSSVVLGGTTYSPSFSTVTGYVTGHSITGDDFSLTSSTAPFSQVYCELYSSTQQIDDSRGLILPNLSPSVFVNNPDDIIEDQSLRQARWVISGYTIIVQSVPEPSAYTAISGFVALGVVIWWRFRPRIA